MSDDEREVDVESDDEGNYGRQDGSSVNANDKRAHHNALERKRRDHIKDSFTGLRDSIPTLKGGDKSSRAQILKKASEYILYMRKKNQINQTDLEDIKRQNSHLEAQIRALERAKTTGNFQSAADILSDQGLLADGETLASVTADLHAGSSSGASARTAASGIAVAPGQSLLLSNGGATPDPPKKKMKH